MFKKVTSLIGLLTLTILICVALTPTDFADVPMPGIQSSMTRAGPFQVADGLCAIIAGPLMHVAGPNDAPLNARYTNLYALVMEIRVAETSRSGLITYTADLWCDWFLWCPLD